MPHVNTTSIAIINHFSSKLSYQPSCGDVVKFLWLMDEFHPLTMYDVSKIFNYNFNYISTMSVEYLTNDVVGHGTPKTFHHWSTIVKIKLKGKLCCNYDGQCIWPMVGWHVWWFNKVWDEPIVKWHMT